MDEPPNGPVRQGLAITPCGERVQALHHGHLVADSPAAMLVREQGEPDAFYFPREDVSMEYMSRTDRGSHCPYKGDAAYYTVLMDGQFAENAVWTYEHPFPAMEAIAGRLSFYTDKIEVYEVDDAQVNPRHDEEETAADRTVAGEEDATITVDDVVQHTDSGSGAPQRKPWNPNVDGPRPQDGGLP